MDFSNGFLYYADYNLNGVVLDFKCEDNTLILKKTMQRPIFTMDLLEDYCDLQERKINIDNVICFIKSLFFSNNEIEDLTFEVKNEYIMISGFVKSSDLSSDVVKWVYTV
jgi:hypothetical protein